MYVLIPNYKGTFWQFYVPTLGTPEAILLGSLRVRFLQVALYEPPGLGAAGDASFTPSLRQCVCISQHGRLVLCPGLPL